MHLDACRTRTARRSRAARFRKQSSTSYSSSISFSEPATRFSTLLPHTQLPNSKLWILYPRSKKLKPLNVYTIRSKLPNLDTPNPKHPHHTGDPAARFLISQRPATFTSSPQSLNRTPQTSTPQRATRFSTRHAQQSTPNAPNLDTTRPKPAPKNFWTDHEVLDVLKPQMSTLHAQNVHNTSPKP